MEFSRKVWVGLLLASALGQSVMFSQTADAGHYAEQGQAALASGHLDEAQRNFEQLRSMQPNVAEVHAILGRIYYQERKFNQAAVELKAALKLKPTLPKVHTLLAISLSEMSDYRPAIPGLEDCFQHSAQGAEKQMCGLQLERAYTGLKLDQKAVEVALQMDKLYPDDPEVLYHSSQIYGNMAYQAVRRMNVVAPNSPWRYLAAAEVNESQGATAAAIQQYRQVLEIDPHRPGIHYRIGRTLLAEARRSGAQQEQSEALTEFLAELAIDSTNANAAYEAGEIYRSTSDYPNAEKYFQIAIDCYPDFDDALIGLAAVYLAEEKAQPAVAALRKAISVDPSNEVSWYRLSQAERSLGDAGEQSKAMTEFRRLHQARLSSPSSALQAEQSEVTKQKVDEEAGR
ncbi:TPR domain protein [Acidisarcina polymorpha]|uniref:TPR domain protein n=1 Tax=Acidisarcina polymorpha TaxID=2211140 RepID=A0A2Z5G7J7_9BACT|nr:tetratricopeptide repeat protein [Acidisarcina polymorpha]AXC14949.1 TPR domain protein [Acidisarcina polymorpha]